MAAPLHHLTTAHLDIAFERSGSDGGWPVVLLHGFPYDPRCFDDVIGELVARGADVIVPYLRGFGATRYLASDIVRSGQQAAIGHDLRDLIEGLELERPIVAGFDWGGRAACVVAALWPDLVSGLVTVGGYAIQDIGAMSVTPAPPELESRLWYQWYLHSEHGRAGLATYRAAIARQLWGEWSPTWDVPDGAFEATAPSFDNPDFVDTAVHSYRHRYALVDGDPAFGDTEILLADSPVIPVSTIVVDPTEDPILAPQSADEHEPQFAALIDYRQTTTGHNVPQEDPAAFAAAVIALHDAIT
jgi:pimeloyl-ACP methyl ester carboxylesterase